jgi:hypothetical protein
MVAGMAIDASVLSLFPTSSDTTSSLLGIIYGGSTAGSSGGDPIAAFETAETNQTQDVAAVAAEPQVARDIAAFRAAVASAKTPADLLNNPQALTVLLTANGLGSQTDYTALAQKALLSNTKDSSSLANTLSDTRWQTVAKTYDFANSGLSIIQKPATLDAIASGYAQVQWEDSLDQTTPGLSSALDFHSRASTIKSVDQILGDSTFRTVVTTALGIPEQIAFQPLEAQEKAISSQIDVTKFSDPTFVDNLTKQYLIANAQNNSSSSSSGSSAGSLLSLFT